MDINVFNLLAFFIIYSFLGWILESIFRSFCEKRIVNTGFLIGPVCPIYGLGALIMLLTLGQLKGNYVLIFIISFLMLTLWEYVVGVFLEKVFKTKYWDYSDHKIQFQGRICLTNSIAWGFLGVGFINIIHPFLESVLNSLNQDVFRIIIYISAGIIVLDTIVSVIKAKHIKIKLKKVEELNEQIRQKGQEGIKELKIKRDKILNSLYKYAKRIKDAFPTIKSKEITEVLNKKITLKKKDTDEKRRK
ncbi:MAG: putative ABC transporter permease [Clostridia bacterium]|nr:putative ABC transporter permease [Clostridia bacterium]